MLYTQCTISLLRGISKSLQRLPTLRSLINVQGGGNDMTKYFGYKYLVNWPMIIEIYENPLGYFYCLLHTVRVKRMKFW